METCPPPKTVAQGDRLYVTRTIQWFPHQEHFKQKATTHRLAVIITHWHSWVVQGKTHKSITLPLMVRIIAACVQSSMCRTCLWAGAYKLELRAMWDWRWRIMTGINSCATLRKSTGFKFQHSRCYFLSCCLLSCDLLQQPFLTCIGTHHSMPAR